MPLKFVTVNDNVFQLLGDFVPQTHFRGSAPGPHWGISVPRPPHLCSSKSSLKNPLGHSPRNPPNIRMNIRLCECTVSGLRFASDSMSIKFPW